MRDLYVVHEDSKTIKCAFHTLVVRNEAIVAKYPGGFAAFAEKHRPRCNSEIVVMCAMSEDDLDPTFEDLQANGFERGASVFFDAGYYEFEAGMSGKYPDVRFTAAWLKGKCTRAGVFVWYNHGIITGTRALLKDGTE